MVQSGDVDLLSLTLDDADALEAVLLVDDLGKTPLHYRIGIWPKGRRPLCRLPCVRRRFPWLETSMVVVLCIW